MKKKVILSLFFALGFFSILSQTLIVREFIISFGGNELGIGLFYFFWFFWVGIGSLLVLTLLGKFLYRHFLKLVFLYPLLSLLEIFLFIILKRVADVSWWEFFSLERVFIYLFAFTSFISLFTGIIFTLGVLWLRKTTEEDVSSIITSSYIFEALGSFSAGCLVTLLIVKLVPPLIILTAAGLIFALIAIITSIYFKDRISLILNSALLVVLLFFILNPRELADVSSSLRMKHTLGVGEFVTQVYTPYQHILLGELPQQTVVLSNGEIISSFPEVVDADKEAALFMSQANFPKNVLIFGMGAENLISSLLKFPVENITYCVEDKVYYEIINKNISSELLSALRDKRLEVVFQSARSFLKEKSSVNTKFGLIIIYTPDPSNLVLNTFFTKEFYSFSAANLKKEGVLATRITSAENFIGEEIRNYGSSVYYTLAEVFSKIIIVPGKTNWFFAGSDASYLTEDASILEERLRKIFPSQFSFLPSGFKNIFREERIEFIKNMYIDNPMFRKGKLLNQDNKPLTFFLNLLVMARYSQSYLVEFFKSAAFAGIGVFLIPLFIFFLVRIYFLLKIENVAVKRLLFNTKLFQFFSGFLGFSFHLTLIFLFQNRFGTIFQLIGLVNAIFMLGLCLGGFLGKYLVKKFASVKVLIGIIIAEGILILLAYPLFTGFIISDQMSFAVFIKFFLAAGVLTGCSYPVAAKIFQSSKTSLSYAAVSLELLDHWGASYAGILTGLFMLPLIGVLKTLILLSIICFILITLFVVGFLPFKVIASERIPRFLSFPYIRVSCVLLALSLIFIINSYVLEKKKNIWKEDAGFKISAQTCSKQNDPFPAYVCKSEGGDEYVLESKDFAPDIKGFGGPMNLSVKVDAAGIIKEIKVFQHQETFSYIRRLGIFLEQFKDRNLSEGFSLSNVDAISGATVTSTAVIDIVNVVSRAVGKDLGVSQEIIRKEEGKPLIIVDAPALYLIAFTVIAVILYVFFPKRVSLRRIHLLLVILFLGFGFNMTFSFFHLGNLLSLNIGSLKYLSQILIYAIPLVLGLLFGQIWCGWLCPFGALQEILGSSRLRLEPSRSLDEKARYFKYIFLTTFILIVVLSKTTSWFRQEPLSIFFLKSAGLLKDKFLSLVILFFAIFFWRFWCRYFCVCGAFLSLFNKIAFFRRYFIKKYAKCRCGVKNLYDIDCIRCNLCFSEENRGKEEKD
jgi:spermidine synthase